VTADETIRQLLNRRDLAAGRPRAAHSRRLGLGESEMLAVAHLAQRGQLTPTELGALLDLSSGGVSALVQRLEDAGHVTRAPNPSDGRSNIVRLAPGLIERASAAFAPLIEDLDRLSSDLDEAQLLLVRRFLSHVVDVSERHAERALRHVPLAADEGAGLSPPLWG